MKRAMRLIVDRFDKHIQNKLKLIVQDEVEAKLVERLADILESAKNSGRGTSIKPKESKGHSFISKESNTPSYSQFNGVRRPSTSKKSRRKKDHSNMSRKSQAVSQLSSPYSGSVFNVRDAKGETDGVVDNHYFNTDIATVLRQSEEPIDEMKHSDNLLVVSESTSNINNVNTRQEVNKSRKNKRQ